LVKVGGGNHERLDGELGGRRARPAKSGRQTTRREVGEQLIISGGLLVDRPGDARVVDHRLRAPRAAVRGLNGASIRELNRASVWAPRSILTAAEGGAQ